MKTVQIVDTSNGEKPTKLQLGGPAVDPDDPLGAIDTGNRLTLRVTFSRNGKVLRVASDRLVTVWDIGRERQIGQIPLGEETLQHAILSPDGRTIALETSAGTSIWELATFLKRLSLHQNVAVSNTDRLSALQILGEDPPKPMPLAFSSDGRLLARAGQDRKVRLFDAWTGKEVGSFEGHRGNLMSAAFSQDGQKLVTASADTTSLVWDLSSIREKLKPPTAEIDDKRAEEAWSTLYEQDAAKAHIAIRVLAGDPTKSVAFMRDLVEPATGPDGKLLAKLIADLGNVRFAVREKASKELDRLGDAAAPALRRAAEIDTSPEIRKAAKKLLDNIGIQAPTRDQLRSLRVVEVLERIGTADAAELLKKLAGGAPEVIPTPQAQSALERLNIKK
jgi:WD40 repeat protein